MPAPAVGKRPPAGLEPSQELAWEQLQRILDSKEFSRAESLRRLLQFLVEETLLGRGDHLNEYSLGQEVFGRGAGFDPKLDTIVRVQTRKLRAKLDEYYRTRGCDDRIVLQLPKGRYGLLVDIRNPLVSSEAVGEQPSSRPVRRRVLAFSVVACVSAAVGLLLLFPLINQRPSQPAMKSVPFTTFVGRESDPAFA
jgi:hypothetical protein